MDIRAGILKEPGICSAFAEARVALVGFGAESHAIASFLNSMGSMVQILSPDATEVTTEADWYTAVLLNLTPALSRSPWTSIPKLLALKTPLLVAGTVEELNRFPALQVKASEVIFRPFHYEELCVRIGRCLARSARQRDSVPDRKYRIVVADDDPAILSLTAGILRARKFDCYEANNGRNALDFARTLLPDLLVLDVNMPFLSGFKILSALRADPATAAMKVLIFTGDSADSVVEQSVEFGADGYLRKPFQPFDFLRRVKALLPSLVPIGPEVV